MAFYAGRVILRAGDGEPDARRAHRPQRPRRPALRHLLALPGAAAPAAGAGRERADLREKLLRWRRAAWCSPPSRSSFPRRKGDRHPVLSDRRNIVVIADEAHRSQYDFIDGFARHMRDALPNASFIGFTGTPIEKTDANTRGVRRLHQRLRHPARGRGRRDGADLLREPAGQAGAEEGERPEDRPEFEEATEGEEVERKEKLKSQVGAARGRGRRRETAQARSPRTSSSTSRSGWRRWTARRWSSA